MQFVDSTNYSLPTQREAQNQVFGGYTKKDMNDYSQAAYNYLMHQQDNALQIALMNYQNQYNSPQNQMVLRQAAGINPYSGYQVQGAASPSVGSSPQFRSSGVYSKKLQIQQQAIGNLLNTLETGTKIYDYLKYGRDLSKYQLDAAIGRSNILSEQVQQEVMRTGMQAWMLGYPGYEQVGSSPYGERYSAQTHNYDVQQQRADAYKRQINYLVEHLYPSQVDRNEALKQLDEQKYGIQDAQYGAITGIHTGNSTADGILQFLLMMFRESLRFGFTGRIF